MINEFESTKKLITNNFKPNNDLLIENFKTMQTLFFEKYLAKTSYTISINGKSYSCYKCYIDSDTYYLYTPVIESSIDMSSNTEYKGLVSNGYYIGFIGI